MVANYSTNKSVLYLLSSFVIFNGLLYDTMPIGYFVFLFVILCTHLIIRNKTVSGLFVFSTIPLAIYLTGQFRSVECATFILGTLCVLKAFEVKHLRDLFSYYVIYILFMAGSILLTTEIIAIAAVVYSLGAMFYNLGQITRVTYERGRLTLMLLISVAFVSVLYLIIPQVGVGGAFSFSNRESGSTGISEELKPGTISELVLDKSVHYIIEMGAIPKSYYWRAYTFNRTDGKRWWGRTNFAEVKKDSSTKYDFKVNKIGRRILPVIKNKEMEFSFGNKIMRYYQNEYGDIKMPRNITSYYLSNGDEGQEEKPDKRKAKIRLSSRLTSKLDEFKGLTTKETVRELIKFFRSLNLEYSLVNASFSTSDISGFLFDTKKGYCEHFASAFSLALNYLEIQSHVVVGYYGGEFNKTNNYLVLKGENAHAWIEYFDGREWVNFDPVEFIVSSTSLPRNEMSQIKDGELLSSRDQSFSLDDFLYGNYLRLNYLFFSFDLESQKELYRDFKTWIEKIELKNLKFYKSLTFFLLIVPILLFGIFLSLSDAGLFRLLKWRSKTRGSYDTMESFLPLYQFDDEVKKRFLSLYLERNYCENHRPNYFNYQLLKWRVLLKI